MNLSASFKNETIFDDTNELNEELDLIEYYLIICEKLFKIYPIVLLTIGTLGNLISFVVLIYGSRKKSTTFSYLSCLALIDLAVIATFTTQFISLYNFDKDLQDNVIYCKLFAFLVYYLPQYSAWTLSIVSVDRMIGLIQVNVTHRFENSTTVKSVQGITRHLTIRDRIRRIKMARPINLKKNSKDDERLSFNCFCNKKQKNSTAKADTNVATTSNTTHTVTNNKRKIKKKCCLTECFNKFLSLYSFPTSEKYRAFVIVSIIGFLLFLLNSHFLFIYDKSSSSGINFYKNISIDDNDDQLISILSTNLDNYNQNISSFNTIEHLLKRKKLSNSSIMILLNGVNVIKCSAEHNQKFKNFYKIWVHVDSIVNVYLPFAVMIISSITIIMCVLKSMKAAGNNQYNKIARNISIMLVSINVLFIALTAPIVIQLAIDASSSIIAQNITLPTKNMQWQSLYSEEPLIVLSSNITFTNINEENRFYRNVNKEIISIAKKRLIKLICIIIMNSNHATNIMVYCLIGREFRLNLMCVIRRFIYGDSKYKQLYRSNPHYKNNINLKMSIKMKKIEEGDCMISTTSSAKHVSNNSKSINIKNKRLNPNNDDQIHHLSQDDQFEQISHLKPSESEL